jgi:hypothetical protein
VSVVLPCLDEERPVGECTPKPRGARDADPWRGVVVDNGSIDASRDVAQPPAPGRRRAGGYGSVSGQFQARGDAIAWPMPT